MARIRWVEESSATGPIAEVYANWMNAHPGRTEIPGILKALSLRPELLQAIDQISDQIQFRDGHLSERIKEMIATTVSALNQTSYCTGGHAYFLSLHEPDPRIPACLSRFDLDAAPLIPAERALLDFAVLVSRHAYRTTDADVATLRNHGWTDPQIAECVYVTALFAFFNRVADAFGIDGARFRSERSLPTDPGELDSRTVE